MNKLIMRKSLLLLLCLGALLASCSKVDTDPKVIVITFDGLRWQEVFTGADSVLVSDPKFAKNPEARS